MNLKNSLFDRKINKINKYQLKEANLAKNTYSTCQYEK